MDASKKEQLTIVIRYLDSQFDVCESFVSFIEPEDTTGITISQAILAHITKLGLNPERMVAQSFDGASNISGRFNGVQAYIHAVCPYATYVHCFSHCLNLILTNASLIPEIAAVATSILSACNYFKNSSRRIKQLQDTVERLSPEARHVRLKQLCATRWVDHHDSVFVFIELFKPLLDVLTANSELAIANAITEPGFMVCIHILQRILGVTKGLSVVLQSKKMNFISALEEIDNVVATLQTWHSDEKDEEFCSVFASAEQLFAYAEMLPSANIPLPRLADRQRNRTNVPAASSMEYYKRAAWYPFLDAVLAELHERFNQHSTAALRMAAIIPANCVDAPFASLEPSINRYGPLLPDGFEGIRQEFLRWQRKWQANAVDQRPSTLPEAMSRCDPTVYPNVAVLSEIFSTIPVTTATAEQSFSQLRLLKNYMRPTMVEERLNGLAFMAIRKDIRFAYDDVIDQYALDYNPRMKFQ